MQPPTHQHTRTHARVYTLTANGALAETYSSPKRWPSSSSTIAEPAKHTHTRKHAYVACGFVVLYLRSNATSVAHALTVAKKIFPSAARLLSVRFCSFTSIRGGCCVCMPHCKSGECTLIERPVRTQSMRRNEFAGEWPQSFLIEIRGSEGPAKCMRWREKTAIIYWMALRICG